MLTVTDFAVRTVEFVVISLNTPNLGFIMGGKHLAVL